jgi:glycosyltransferase involved in cell wall biosynthesis
MTIGYLHIGPKAHGVSRYGRLIATEACQRPDIAIVEAHVVLEGGWLCNRSRLRDAIRHLSSADVIHIQYNKAIWGGGWRQLYFLWFFLRLSQITLAVTVHDIYTCDDAVSKALTSIVKLLRPAIRADGGTLSAVAQPLSKKSLKANILRFLRFLLEFGRDGLPSNLALRLVLSRATTVFVCTREEARRLKEQFSELDKLTVVPHFVEDRAVALDRAATRRDLGLEGYKVVTVLGYIHRRKGHELVVEAISELPEDVKVVFAGKPSPGYERFLERMIALAEHKGLGDHLRVTGYLSEQELEQYLIATDLALCPFKDVSASSSIATWISAGRRILAYDLPLVHELNELVPGAVNTFAPYTPSSLARAITDLLYPPGQASDPSLEKLRRKLSIKAMVDKHVETYRGSRESADGPSAV